MSYYYDEEQDLPRRPSLGWRLLLIAAAIVPILVSVFVVFWFIRAYISPPKVALPAPTAQDAADGSKETPDADVGQSSGASPTRSLPRPSGLPSRMAGAGQATRAPAYADAEPALAGTPAAARASPWPPAAAAGGDEASVLSPADAIAARSSPMEKVPLPRRRPAQAMAAADPSAEVPGVVPLPRNRPPLAHDAPPAEVPATSTERPDRNF
jgi:hypothetical protein